MYRKAQELDESSGGGGAMLFAREEPLKLIIAALAQIESTCRLEGSIGLNDSKVLAQHFFCELLNALHGLDLKVLDRIKPSFPAIDLGDSEKKRCFQVSSTKSADKIQETLDKYQKYELQKAYGQLEIIVIGEPQDSYKTVTVPTEVSFDVSKHVKGTKELVREIEKHLGTARLQKLVEVIITEMAHLPVSVKDGLKVRFDPNRDITTQKHSVGYSLDEIIRIVRIGVQTKGGSSTIKNCRAYVTQIDRVVSSATVIPVLHDARRIGWENQRDGFEPIDVIPGIDFRADLVVAERNTPQALGAATNTNVQVPVFVDASWPSVLRVMSLPPYYLRNAGIWIFTVGIGADGTATETLRLKVTWDGTVNGLSAEVV